ncbi:MAG: hypothetical protein KKC25_06775 [Proteobacteria bacterium]|nr:hypothetical protein [Pseudomonadota bacterium]
MKTGGLFLQSRHLSFTCNKNASIIRTHFRSIEDSPQQAAGNLLSLRGTNNFVFARLPRGKPRGMSLLTDSNNKSGVVDLSLDAVIIFGSSPNRVGKINADYAANACLAWVNGLLNAEKI